MKKVKVSIIVPVYNVEKYIEKCLESLVNQTLKEIEIIVVNDGSPDESQKIIDKYVKKYPKKVKSFIKENGGQGSARNYGFKKSSGEYIGYVDSDDYVELDMYEKLYNAGIKNNSDIVICGCYCVYEDTDSKGTSFDRKIENDNKKNAYFGKTAVWNKIFKRELIEENSLEFRSKVWYEDFDFSLNILSCSKKVTYLNEPLYDYLIRQGSTMNNSNIEKNLEIFDAFDMVKDNNNIDETILEYLAIEHILLAASTRVINADVPFEKKAKVIKKIRKYMKENFPNFKNNKYKYVMSRGQKIIYYLLVTNQIWLFDKLYKLNCKRSELINERKNNKKCH